MAVTGEMIAIGVALDVIVSVATMQSHLKMQSLNEQGRWLAMSVGEMKMKTDIKRQQTRFWWVSVLLFGLVLQIAGWLMPAVTLAASGSDFDHFSTGFPLTGGHRRVECDSCHLSGIFVGTPERCNGCHNNVRASGKPASHIRTNNTCDDCHTSANWRLARFDHGSVSGNCVSCHNGSTAIGKNTSSAHIKTSNTCEFCHSTFSWGRVSRVDHQAVIGTCKGCHNGSTAKGKHGRHIKTNESCDSCHISNNWRMVFLTTAVSQVEPARVATMVRVPQVNPQGIYRQINNVILATRQTTGEF